MFFANSSFGIRASWLGLIAAAVAFVLVAVETGMLTGVVRMISREKTTA